MDDQSANNMKLWRSGQWLSHAPELFTNIRAKRTQRVEIASTAWRTIMEREPEKAAEIKKIADELSDWAAKSSQSADLVQRRRGDFLERIYAGELIGLGFPLDAPAGDHPQEIPLQLFDEQFLNWSKCEVISEHFHFIQVKIAAVPRSTSPSPKGSLDLEPRAVVSDGPQVPPKRKKPGPNPGGDELRRLYVLLKNDGTIKKDHTVKAAWAAVVTYTEAHPSKFFKNGRGLKYSTFAREISAKSTS